MDWRNDNRILHCYLYRGFYLPHCQVWIVISFLFSKKPLFSTALIDKKSPFTFKAFLGYVLAGIGFGLGGMIFESFLLTVPSS